MKHLSLAIALILSASIAQANDFRPAMQDYLDQQISEWAADPVLISAIQAQNARTADFDATQIATLDQTWRGFVGISDDADIIAGVIQNPAAEFLRDRMQSSNAVITEIFVMDAIGLNVAATAPTSDYWQGDEEKFTQTYPRGTGAAHFGDLEIDASTKELQGQVSLTISDPETGIAIGAMTVGISLPTLTAMLN